MICKVKVNMFSTSVELKSDNVGLFVRKLWGMLQASGFKNGRIFWAWGRVFAKTRLKLLGCLGLQKCSNLALAFFRKILGDDNFDNYFYGPGDEFLASKLKNCF